MEIGASLTAFRHLLDTVQHLAKYIFSQEVWETKIMESPRGHLGKTKPMWKSIQRSPITKPLKVNPKRFNNPRWVFINQTCGGLHKKQS